MTILDVALSQFGVVEIPGKGHNKTILKWFKEIKYSGIKNDETAWCSCFINWCALKAGLVRSGYLNARSWLKVGDEIKNPLPGDIAIFWRSSISSWKGHVGIYINTQGNYINVLGGNQNNKVCIKKYPKSRLLGYRRLGAA